MSFRISARRCAASTARDFRRQATNQASCRFAAPLVVLLFAIMAALAAARPAAAETMGKLSLDDSLIVRGVEAVDPQHLARSLVADDDLLLLSGPLASRKSFLAAVARKATLALQREGCAEPQVTAVVESSGAGERVAVDVVEGPRHMAAGIEVTGLPDELAAGLRRWLQSQRPPLGAVPQSIDMMQDGWSGVRWLDHQGQPARMEDPVWNRGRAAPFDPPHLQTVRQAIGRFLRDEGYFAAAKLVEERQSVGRFAGLPLTTRTTKVETSASTFAVSVRPGADGAVLAIDFRDLPRASVLKGIDLLPGPRTTAADLQKVLAIVDGSVVTDRDRLAWRETLRRSGRFIRYDVKLKETAASEGDGGVPGIVVVFDLEEYPAVTPLAEPLSREEQTLLLFREWLLKTLAGGDDLVAQWKHASDAAASATDAPAGGAESTGLLVVSPRHGMLVTALPQSPAACGVAVSGDGLGLFLPRAGGRFEMPVPTHGRVTANISLDLTQTIEVGKHIYHRHLSVGAGMGARPREAHAPFAITVRIEPVACLSLVHEGNPDLRWEGDELIVTSSDITARIDSRSGRPVSLQSPQAGSVAIDASPGRLAAELTAMREASGGNVARDDALVSSAVEFFTSDAAAGAFAPLIDITGVAKQLAHGKDRVAAFAKALRRTAESGGFAAVDRAVADALARADAELADPAIAIPADDKPEVDLMKTITRLAAAMGWRVTEQNCGRDSWPAALARVAALGTAQDPGALKEMAAYATAPANGPVACLTAASLVPMPMLAATIARHGQERLSQECFREDCKPVLQLLAACGLDRCTVALLRTVDDVEANLLGATLLRDGDALLPLIEDLRGRQSDAAALAALPQSLDNWWEASLRKTVAAALADRASPRTAGKQPDAGQPAR